MNAPFASEPQPAGEGAALIAATEQEIAEDENCIGIIQQREAWEATARRLAALLDDQQPVLAPRCWSCGHEPEMHQPEGCWYAVDQGTPGRDSVCPCTVPRERTSRLLYRPPAADPAPVQATTHGEAGEAQGAAEGAEDETAEIERIFREHYESAARFYGASGEPAVQGAGRDWRTPILEAFNWVLKGDDPKEVCTWLVAAVGLRDLEQAAARNERLAAEWRADMEYAVRYRTERDAARRELEQLRGGIARVHDRIAADARTNPFQPEKAKLERICGWLTDEMAAADLGLAAGALATQDGEPKA